MCGNNYVYMYSYSHSIFYHIYFSRELKEEAKSRLSGLCTDTPQKEESRSRIVSMVSRLHKQGSGLIEEISTLHDQNDILKTKSEDLVEKSSSKQLLAAAELGNLQIGNIELKNQVRKRYSP